MTGRLGHADAVGDVVAALERRLAAEPTGRRLPEIRILTDFGDPGRHALFRLAEEHEDLRFAALSELASHGYRAALEPAARQFEELVRNESWAPEIASGSSGRQLSPSGNRMLRLAKGLLSLDANRAYPLVCQACLTVKEPLVRLFLANEVRELLRRKPELEQIEVPIAPIRFQE
ncbi:MAG: hypothetical protein ACYTG0_10205 [Planctomycetota bacterium]